MKRLILHIGMHKTGTTSLQLFMRENAEVLSDRGIAVPDFSKYPATIRNRNGHFLMVGARFVSRPQRRRKRFVKLFERDYSKFKRVVAKRDTVLLSDERFWYEGSWDASFWTELRALAEAAGIEDVKLVVYMRRQDEYALSHWKQLIKKDRCETLEEYVTKPATVRELEYYNGLRAIESVFGEGSVTVRVFDRASFHGGDIYHDFCSCVGIPWSDKFTIPTEERNPSYSDTASQVKLWANQNEAYRNAVDESNFLHSPASHASRENPDPRNVTLYTRELYEEMRAKYLPINQEVAKRYLDGNGGVLVEWPPFEKQVWEACTEQTLKVIVQMLTEAISRQDHMLRKQSQLLQEQKEMLREQARQIEELRRDFDTDRQSGFLQKPEQTASPHEQA